ERRVHAGQLREIGQLVWSRHVADGGEKGVLHERTEQHVGAELLWTRANRLEQSGIDLANGFASAVEVKERDLTLLRRHLGVIPARLQFLARFECEPRRLARVGEFV